MRIIIFSLLSGLLLVLTGCGGTTPTPSPSLVSSATPTAVAEGTTPLTTDGFTIALPDDWLDVIGEQDDSQQGRYLISVCSPDKLVYFALGTQPVPQGKTLDAYMAETVQQMRDTMTSNFADLISEPATVAGYDAYHVSYTVSGVPTAHYIFYAGDRLVTVTTGNVSDTGLYNDELQAILDSLTVQP